MMVADGIDIEIYGLMKRMLEGKLMDLQTRVNDRINTVFTVWQESNIVKHRKLTPRLKRFISQAILDYSIADICDAIRNYSKVLHDDAYWYSLKFSLDTFLSSKIDLFIEENKPLDNFKRFNTPTQSGIRVAGGQPPPGSPAISPDSLDNFKEKFKQWKKEKEKN